MHQDCGHIIMLLLIVLLPKKSGGNGSEFHYLSTERYVNTTTYLINSPRNQSVQTVRAFGENSNRNNPWKKPSSTSTDRELREEEKFVRQRRGMNIMESQTRANKKTIEIFLTPIRQESGVYFKAERRNNTAKIKTINFCCPLYHRLSLEQSKCFLDHNFIFPFAQNMSRESYTLSNIYAGDISMYRCTKPFIIDLEISQVTSYTFLDDGTVQFPHNNFASPDEYCLAAVNQTGFDLIICRMFLFTYRTFVFVGISVTLIFLLITFVVYSVLREFRTMHGYTLRAYIASLFVSHTMFAMCYRFNTFTIFSCAFLSFTLTFAMYSSFLWLNIMCFDIWWTFRTLLPVHNQRERRGTIRKTFLIYALYAWGVSFVATILLIIMDFAPNVPDYVVKPEICKYGVWFGTEKAKIIYFYIPIGVTLICNFCLFVWTALKMLCDKKRINRQMKDSESCRHNDCNKERLWMYLKLFIIMGINWIPINLTVKIGSVIFDSKSSHAWFLANLLTPLQGIIIFIIYVCKKNVRRLLMQRFKWSSESRLCYFRVRRADRPN